MKKLIITTIVLGLFVTPTAFAGSGVSGTENPCQPTYGNGTACTTQTITVNKTVQNPTTGAFVDNLTVNDPRFAPNQTVTFHISVTDTGTAAISNLQVTDKLPDNVIFTSGPGSFNPLTKTLTITEANLNPQETKNYTVTAKTTSDDVMPTGVTCLTNTATATAGNSVTDTASFCVEKQVTPTPTSSTSTSNTGTSSSTTNTTSVLPAQTESGLSVFPAPSLTTTPPTGPEIGLILGMIPTGLAGLALQKKASK